MFAIARFKTNQPQETAYVGGLLKIVVDSIEQSNRDKTMSVKTQAAPGSPDMAHWHDGSATHSGGTSRAERLPTVIKRDWYQMLR
jgi:hypothetical protein